MQDGAPQVGPAGAAEQLAAGATAIDVREAEEWDAGRMAGSVWIPLGQFGSRMHELPDGPLVIVCRSGARSGMVADALVSAGRDASNLAGGLKAWVAAGRQLEPADGYVL
jgi:rhodanese-related sulfurtransferase